MAQNTAQAKQRTERLSALRALVPLSCFPPGWWLLPGGCCPPPPSPFFVSRFSWPPLGAVCRVLCCAVRPWVRCCAALLRVVSSGVVLSCAVLCSLGAAACCAVPSGARVVLFVWCVLLLAPGAVVCPGAVLGLVARGFLLVACFGVGVPVWPRGLFPCG